MPALPRVPNSETIYAVPADIKHAHQLLDQLGPDKLEAVSRLLEVLVESDSDESLSGDDREAVATSREYFRRNPGGGVPFEQVIADLGFSMDQVRGSKGD